MNIEEVTLFTLSFISRILVGGVFVVAAIAKLTRPVKEFQLAILGYRLIPERLATLLARYLPPIELLVGLCLITGLFIQFASIVSICLLLTFTTALILALRSGKHVDCGCIGSVRIEKVQQRLVWRNAILMLISGWLMFTT